MNLVSDLNIDISLEVHKNALVSSTAHQPGKINKRYFLTIFVIPYIVLLICPGR
jgi:hypothetical protein